ncbi:MAG: PaaI family thioesterase [Pseudomonadota bacterium]
MSTPFGFRELVGYEVAEWREGYARITLALGGQHGNRMGIVHGGVYMTVLDAAMGHAATYDDDPAARKRCVTVSMTTNFLKPADGATLVAIGLLQSVHDDIAVCRGRIVNDDGKLLMTAQASFLYLPGRPER